MLDINFYMAFHKLIQELDKEKEYTADEMMAMLEAKYAARIRLFTILKPQTAAICAARCVLAQP